MDKLNRLMACLFLTIICLCGLGVSEYLELEITAIFCLFGFAISGISTLVLAFRECADDDEEDDDDTDDN